MLGRKSAFPRQGNTSSSVGSDDAVKAWLNGKLVLDNWVQRGVIKDDDLVPVQLQRGANTLLLKIQNGDGPWGFTVRLANSAGLTESLVMATLAHDPARVSHLLTNGADVNAKTGPALTPWQAAQICGRQDIARLLTEHGARTNAHMPKPDTLTDWYRTSG